MSNDSIFQIKPIRWREHFELIQRRSRLIIGLVLLGVAAGLFLAINEEPVYRARATILLSDEAVPGPRQGAMSDREINAELALLTSSGLIRSALDALNEGSEGVTDPRDRPRKVREVTRRIKVEQLQRSSIVEVTYADGDPQWASTFVNALLDKHVERIAQLESQTAAQSFYESQRGLLGVRWQEAEAELTRYREEQGLLEGDVDDLRRIVAELDGDRVDAETEVLQLQAKERYLTAELERHPEVISSQSRVSEDDSVGFLKERLLELEMERSEKLSGYTETSTVIRNIDRQIEQARALLLEKEGETLSETTTTVNPTYQTLESELLESRSDLTAARARVEALTTQISRYRERVRKLEDSAGELARLEGEAQAAEEAHREYLRQEEQARLSGAMDESRNVNVSIVDRAEVPEIPESSKGRFLIALGGLMGLALGILLAFVLDWLNPSVKSAIEATRLTGARILAEIPID